MPLDSRILTNSTCVDPSLNLQFENLLNQGRIAEAACVFDSSPFQSITPTPPIQQSEPLNTGTSDHSAPNHLQTLFPLQFPYTPSPDVIQPPHSLLTNNNPAAQNFLSVIEDPLDTYPSPPFEEFYTPPPEQPPLVWTTPENERYTIPESVQRALTVHINENHTLVHIPHRSPTPGSAHTEHVFVDAILDLLDSSLFLLDQLVTHEGEILESIFGTDTDTTST